MILLYALQVAVVITLAAAGIALAAARISQTQKNRRHGERIVASDLTNNVKACRPLTSKGIAEVLDPFVTRGWLTPENDFPGNRAWFFDPAIRTAMAERGIAERARRTAIRAQIDGLAARRQR
jgi:hypothetical protein